MFAFCFLIARKSDIDSPIQNWLVSSTSSALNFHLPAGLHRVHLRCFLWTSESTSSFYLALLVDTDNTGREAFRESGSKSGGRGRGTSSVAPSMDPPVVDLVNTPHYVKVADAVKDIAAHPLFDDILGAEPLKRGDNSDRCGFAGIGLPLTKSTHMADMKNSGHSECCSNFFDQDWRFTCSPGVPVNAAAVQKIADRDFRTPKPCPMIQIGAETVGWDPTTCRGAWRRITPEEVIHAYILAVARDVRDPASTQELNSKTLATLKILQGPATL